MSVKSNEDKPVELGFKNVVRLGYASLSTDVSTEMILGVLPFFIVKDLGGTAGILGIIEGVAEAVNYLFRVFAGVVTDKIRRRKPLVLLGYALSSIAKPLFAVSASWSQAFIVRITDRAGKGIRTSPRDALISDSVSSARSGRAFGLHRSLDQLGAVMGPILAFAVIPFIGIRGVFLLSFVPAAMALTILLFFVRDSAESAGRSSVFQNAREVLNRRFILLLLTLGVFAAGAYNFSFILLKAGDLGLSESQIPLVYAVVNVGAVVLGVPAGILADRIGKVPVLGLSYMIFIVTSLGGLLLAGNPLYAFLIGFLFGSYLAISETVQRAIIPDFAKPQLKGTAYAIYYSVIGLGSLVANVVFGGLWSGIGPTAAFQYSVAAGIVGFLVLVTFLIREARQVH